MKLHFFFLLAIITGCGGPSSKQTPSSPDVVSLVDIPPDAVRQKFLNNPAIEKITINAGNGMQTQGQVLNGKKSGSWIDFINSMPTKSTSFVDGVKEGWYFEFGQTGQLVRRISYHNNLRNGNYTEYNYGTVKEERTYQDDKLEGVVKIYYPNGKIQEEGSYKNGTRDGISRWYNEEGQKTIEYEYKDGKLVKK